MRSTTALKLLAPLGVLTLLLTGCSSDSGSDTDASASGSADTSDAAATTSGSDTSASSGSGDIALVSKGKLTVCTNPPFAPFEYTEGDAIVGFDMDLTGEVAKDLGVELAPLAAPFESLESGVALDSGTCDIVASGMTITEERQGKIDFSDPYFDDDLGVLVPVGSDIASADQLEGTTVSVQEATTGADYCNEAGATCLSFEDVGLQVQAVSTGSADAAVNNLSVMYDAVVKNPDLKVIAEVPSGEQYGLGVKKGNTALLDAVNATLARITSDGTYDTLYAKYFSELS